MVSTKTRPPKVQFSIGLDADQVEDLDALATHWRTTRAAVVRRALDFFLAHNIVENDTVTTDTDGGVADVA